MSQAAEYSYSYFIDRGYSPQAAAAIVGNFEHESSFKTKAIHDSGSGYGIAGWRDPPGEKGGRRKALYKFAENNNLNPSSLGTQLQFTDYELRTSEKQAGKALKKAKTVEEANDAMMHYERPKGYSPDRPQAGLGYKSRLAKAQNAMASYGGDAAMSNPDMPVGPDERGSEADIVDNTNTEAVPTHDMAWNEDSAATAASDLVDKPSTGSKIKHGIKNLLTSMGEEKQQVPLDYTPAGDSTADASYDPNDGAVPVDGYKRYANYAGGGNVQHEFIDPRDWFAMFEG